MDPKVLFVDDEKNILQSLKRLFFDSDIEFMEAESGNDALEVIQSENISVIVSDMRMPGMSGVELLSQVASISPNTVRIVLSGQSDMKSVLAAVNNGHIWRYLEKPWDDDNLVITVNNAIELHNEKIEKALLQKKIEEKNKILANVNKYLAREIHKKTWQLEERTKILNMIVSGGELHTILNQTCAAISKITHLSSLYVVTGLLNSVYSFDNSAPPQYIHDDIEDVWPQEIIANSQYLAIPMIQSESYLGVFVIDDIDNADVDGLIDVINSFSYFIGVVLYHEKITRNAASMTEDIERLMENL